jgi:hypothetical protein
MSTARTDPLTVTATLAYWPASAPDITCQTPRRYDMRTTQAYMPEGVDYAETTIHDARNATDLGLHTSGFELIARPSAVQDFYDTAEVMRSYYEECKALARKLTGATVVATYDHLIREPGRQISGGGTDRMRHVTGAAAGGGYIHSVHMDYTDNTTWDAYLALHGEKPPTGAQRVYALNFWRPLSEHVDDFPLAVCDARTVVPEDLFETVVLGYGAASYSWHDIGIETYTVKASPRQRWYYYPRMSPQEVLVIKSYDSAGVIGRACPHSAFANPRAQADCAPRRSIELRVLCFVT